MLGTYIIWGGILVISAASVFAASALMDILQRLEQFHADYRTVNDLEAREEMDEHLGQPTDLLP